MEAGEGVGCAVRDADQAEPADVEVIEQRDEIVHGIGGARSADEVGAADAGAVWGDQAKAAGGGLVGDPGCLVVRADQAVEDQGRVPGGVAEFGEFNPPAGRRKVEGMDGHTGVCLSQVLRWAGSRP